MCFHGHCFGAYFPYLDINRTSGLRVNKNISHYLMNSPILMHFSYYKSHGVTACLFIYLFILFYFFFGFCFCFCFCFLNIVRNLKKILYLLLVTFFHLLQHLKRHCIPLIACLYFFFYYLFIETIVRHLKKHNIYYP